MISKSIRKAFSVAKSRGWNKIYVAIDIHDTILASNYLKDTISRSFFPGALNTLQYLSKRKDVVLIMYTSSHPDEIWKYKQFFEINKIHFDYENENPEVTTTEGYGCYDKKFYFNVLIEDKAGFDADQDWLLVQSTFEEFGSL